MRIGMVTDTYLPRINGVSRSIERFSNKLRQLGHDVLVFAPSYDSMQDADEQVWRFPSKLAWNNNEDRAVIVKHPSVKALMHQVNKLQLDIIHTHTPFELSHLFLQYANQVKVPIVHTYHTWFDGYVEHYAKPIPVFLAKFLMRSMTTRFCNKHQAIIAPSKAMHDMLLSYGIKQPIHTIATGADTPVVKMETIIKMKQQLGLPDTTPIVLIAGRVAYEKNLEFLLDVCKEVIQAISEVKVIIAGDGPAMTAVQNGVVKRHLQKKVLFTGWVDQEAMEALYKLASVHLLASRTETQGLVLTEAMASGVVTIGIPALGTTELLRQGGISATENVSEFSNEVIGLLEDEQYRFKMEENVKRSAKQYSVSQCTARLEKIYNHLKK